MLADIAKVQKEEFWGGYWQYIKDGLRGEIGIGWKYLNIAISKKILLIILFK